MAGQVLITHPLTSRVPAPERGGYEMQEGDACGLTLAQFKKWFSKQDFRTCVETGHVLKAFDAAGCVVFSSAAQYVFRRGDAVSLTVPEALKVNLMGEGCSDRAAILAGLAVI